MQARGMILGVGVLSPTARLTGLRCSHLKCSVRPLPNALFCSEMAKVGCKIGLAKQPRCPLEEAVHK